MTQSQNPCRILWLTAAHRAAIWTFVDGTLRGGTTTPDDRDQLKRVAAELESLQRRHDIMTRVSKRHVVGLRLPADSLPVRLAADEITVLARLGEGMWDPVLTRLLRPDAPPPGCR